MMQKPVMLKGPKSRYFRNTLEETNPKTNE